MRGWDEEPGYRTGIQDRDTEPGYRTGIQNRDTEPGYRTGIQDRDAFRGSRPGGPGGPESPRVGDSCVTAERGCPQGSGAEAEAVEQELLEDYRFGRQQLIEIWGHACAVAVTKAFPLPSLRRRQPTLLVLCGPGQNGAIGLVCARHLRSFDYEPTIFYPKRSPDPLHRDFTTQCEKMDIPFLSYLPTEVQLVNDAYNAVVDAVLGAEVTEGTEPCAAILATLRHIRIPIVSLDVPSGWSAGAGDSGDISPDVLVSLVAPKECARRFQGRSHFLAGRFVPEELRRKFGISGPEYPGSDCVVAL
ncbi:PREDICTED: yjeF N-terminal domain-containing protein 3 [Pseudopodoces humilis]|uniref:yjeF N-terminal domain-containing protein 3 n=1 Tax=Pseudopodoces humilis TaxID=181119 RepID=UPI000395966E|nr:PREDICTED: yjeF N-terminal domain-containing protein 3 [Pseudopodoces humilis]